MPKKLPADVSYCRSKEMFKVAINGWIIAFKEEKNFRFDGLMAFLAIILGCYFQIDTMEWISLVLVIGLVLMAEIINTAIENIVDFICPHYDLRAKKIKDLSCGAVLVVCLVALIIGFIIFIPYLTERVI